MDFTEATRPLLKHLTVIARRILADEDLARDAVQEAMVSLWLEREMPRNVRAWLTRTVVHRSLHLARCRSRRRRHEDQARFDHAEESDRDNPARSLEGQELRRILEEALDQIGPDHRQVLVLSAVERMDYRSIATTLQVPVGTVRSRLSRSRRAFRDALIRTLPEAYHGLLPR